MTDKISPDSDSTVSGEHSHDAASERPTAENGPYMVAYVVPGPKPTFVGPTEAEKAAFRSAKGPCLRDMLGTWPGDVDDGFEDWIRARRRAARLKQWFPY